MLSAFFIYGYDEVGNLVRDDREYISQILWNTRGKITDIIRYYSTNLPSGVSAPATYPPDLHFEYDASGNRVAKIVMPKDASGFPMTPDYYTKTFYLRDAQGNILSTYEDKPNDANFYLEEQNIYGSSRLGMRDEEVNMTPSSPPLACAICPVYFENARGKKNYEMTNHLGNVLTAISDSREAVPNGNQNDYFKAVITSVTDYYPFGMEMPGRSYTSSSYRFGFNGKEKDDEVKSITGSSYDFGARIYDSRICRFFSIDPVAGKYAGWSPYSFSICNPIRFIDVNGFGPGDGLVRVYTTQITMETSSGVAETVYLAKKYYQNVTNGQVAGYNREAQTPNGWYIISKEEHDIQHGNTLTTSRGEERIIRQANPDAFTSHVYGADDLEKVSEDFFTDKDRVFGEHDEAVAHDLTTDEGTFKIWSDDPTSSFEFSLLAVDAKGDSRVLGTIKVEGTDPVYHDFTLSPGEYVGFGETKGGAASFHVGLVTTEAKTSTDRAPDTIDQYGTEEPTDGDIKAIEKLKK